jgi:deoxyribonuclease-4
MYIGAHVSIAGGFDKCIERASKLGSNCLMTFASSPRSLKFQVPSDKVTEKYKSEKTKYEMGPHFFHAPYLVNLAAEDKNYVIASRDLLISYQQLASQIGAVGTIFHIGSHKGSGFESRLTQIVTTVNYVLDSSPRGTRLILENAAGQGGTIGVNFTELREIIDRIGDKPKIGVCLDTQHAFASGIYLDKMIDQFSHEVGIKYLAAIHLNDSKTDFDSHVDRHENLGQGKIGKDILRKFILNCKSKVENCPIILEVPGDGDGPRKKDVDNLKKLIS